MVIWIIGLSGSGKTTVGREVYRKLKDKERATVFVDGDEVRAIFEHDRGDAPYSIEGRRRNAERISELCQWLDRQDIDVVCCILSIFQEMRDENRSHYDSYFEVYMDTPTSLLESRRSLYSEAKDGSRKNVVGVDIPFDPPVGSNIVFGRNDQEKGVEYMARRVLDAIEGFYEE